MASAVSRTGVLAEAAATRHSRPRPALLRALGRDDPPAVIEIGGEAFRRCEVLKHDSWAATAIYQSATRKAICKFNRQQSIAGVPMQWLGRWLATREQRFLERLRGITGIPAGLGPVRHGGRTLPNAVAREFIEGHALAERERVDDAFFPRLVMLLAAVHRRGVAHVDLHKRENILVDDGGRPYLIDFQISFALPRGNRLASAILGSLLRILQRSDEYHLLKHQFKHRPDQAGLSAAEIKRRRPWWIRLHRQFAVPLRSCRRNLLVWLGVRSHGGKAESEVFPEIAHRPVPKRG